MPCLSLTDFPHIQTYTITHTLFQTPQTQQYISLPQECMIDFRVKLNNTQLYVVSLSGSTFVGIEFTFLPAGWRAGGVVHIARTKRIPQSAQIAISI